MKMEDYRTTKNVLNELKNIEKNNWDNMDHITSIDLLLTSNNNGTDKDDRISERFYELKDRMQQVIDSTNEIISLLNEEAE
jgi:hypothetical protein